MRLLGRLPLWSRLLLKALLAMLVPLQFEITSFPSLLNLPFYGLLFASLSTDYYYGIMAAPGAVITSIGMDFLIGIMLASPAILFNYRLCRSPIATPFKKLAAAALVLSYLMIPFVLLIAVPLFGAFYSYMLYQSIETFPTIAVGVFIILPMIQRQATLIASPEDMHSSSPEELQKHPQLGVGREVKLATALWASLCFLPYLVIPPYMPFYAESYQLYSFAYQVTAQYDGGSFLAYELTYIHGSIFPLIMLPIFGVLSSLRLVFVRDIYRYLKHEITHRKLLFFGIFADVFPVIVFTVMMGMISPFLLSAPTVFPLPFLAVVGMLVARLHRSILPLTNRIWADVEARMWFEKEEKRQGVAHVPEKPSQPEDEIITVPLTYMMASHIRKRRHGENSRRLDEE